jgi:folate-binding protein YgfZ
MSGVPRIVAATVDRFVPQMVNLELVGGVDFGKGCYPGQEVVARSQYRGTLKRRAALVQSPVPLLAGQELFSSADPEQPAGLVVLAGTLRGQHHAALVELKIAALISGTLHAGAADGVVLEAVALPYAIPAEAA